MGEDILRTVCVEVLLTGICGFLTYYEQTWLDSEHGSFYTVEQ
jgi:hypothetical protein